MAALHSCCKINTARSGPDFLSNPRRVLFSTPLPAQYGGNLLPPQRIEENYSLIGVDLYFHFHGFTDHFISGGGGFLLPIVCFYFYWVLFLPRLQIQDTNPLCFTYDANIYFPLPCHLSLNFVYDLFFPLFHFLSIQSVPFCFPGVPRLLKSCPSE